MRRAAQRRLGRGRGIGDHQAALGDKALKARLRGAVERLATGIGKLQREIERRRHILERAMEQGEAAIAMAEKAQHRRHAIDGMLQGGRRRSASLHQRQAQADQVAQERVQR